MAAKKFSDTIDIRLMRFFMIPLGFWIPNNRRTRIMMKLALPVTILALSFAWSVVAVDLYQCRNRFDDLAYAACNTMTIFVMLTKFIAFSFKHDKFLKLINHCYKNFWNCEYDSFGESVLRDCGTRCVYCVCSFTFFTALVVFSYTLQPIVENMGRNATDRILPFNMYVNFPIYESPYYEMAFIAEILAMYHCGIIYFSFDNFFCVVSIHVVGQFRILERRLEMLCDLHNVGDSPDKSETPRKDSINDDYDTFSMLSSNSRKQQNAELKAIIRQHESLIEFMKMVEDVYSLVALSQVIIFSLLMCLTAYQAAIVKGSKLLRRFIFVSHSSGTLNQIFMFTLVCDNVTHESQEITNAAYSAKWYNKIMHHEDRRFCRDLMIIMMRASRPCSITAAGFAPISLETFTAIISTTMSYLTMLRRNAE